MPRFLLLLAILITSPLSQAGEFLSLPLSRSDDGGRFFIQSRIAGRERLLALHTSSVQPLNIHRALAIDIGTPVETRKIKGLSIAPSRVGPLVLAGQLPLGHRQAQVVSPAGAVDFSEDGKPQTFSGALGISILSEMDAVLDCSQAELLVPTDGIAPGFYRKRALEEGFLVVPLIKGADGLPLVEITIKDRTFRFLVSSEISINLIEPEVLKAVESPANHRDALGRSALEVEGPVIGGKMRLPRLSFSVSRSGGEKLGSDECPFGGILSTRTLSRIRGKLDFGSYSLVVPPQSP